MTPRVAIIGGGLAGLSAAEALARSGRDRFQITLLEAKQSTGGRAGSFIDPASSQKVDYCQHVAMGCCTNLIGLLARCGLAESMRRYRELWFLHRDHPPSRFAPNNWLPPPLHLAPALGALKYLNRQQRRQIRRGLWRLFRSRSDELESVTAGDWLHAAGQDEATVRDFWSVIIVSALGERVELVNMAMVRKVMIDGFAVARGACDVLVPQIPLAELFGQKMTEQIRNLGVNVQPGRAVSRVRESKGGATVDTHDGAAYDAEHVIVAVPWHAVSKLVPQSSVANLDCISRIPASPITGLHLWFDREITDRPHAVLVGTLAQWVFRDPCGNRTKDSNGYYQVVISGSSAANSLGKKQLVETVLGELRHAFKSAKHATLLRSRIVTDPNSVFSIRPEVEAIRPPARTPLPWLHLAGDWIDTAWPATMEGAVIGGRMAASSVAEQSGMDPIDIDSGLPRGWLARRLIRSR